MVWIVFIVIALYHQSIPIPCQIWYMNCHRIVWYQFAIMKNFFNVSSIRLSYFFTNYDTSLPFPDFVNFSPPPGSNGIFAKESTVSKLFTQELIQGPML